MARGGTHRRVAQPRRNPAAQQHKQNHQKVRAADEIRPVPSSRVRNGFLVSLGREFIALYVLRGFPRTRVGRRLNRRFRRDGLGGRVLRNHVSPNAECHQQRREKKNMHPAQNLSWHGSRLAQLERFTAAEYASHRWRATSPSFSHQLDPTKRPSNGKKHRTNARFRLPCFRGDPLIEIAKPAQLCRLQVFALTIKLFLDASETAVRTAPRRTKWAARACWRIENCRRHIAREAGKIE